MRITCLPEYKLVIVHYGSGEPDIVGNRVVVELHVECWCLGNKKLS